MTAHRSLALGATQMAAALLGESPFRHAAETEFFRDRQLELDRSSALAGLLGGRNLSGLSTLQIPIPVATQVDARGYFLFLKVDWRGDGSDVSYFSEIDLANSRHQLLGRIQQISGFSRGYGTDRNLQRMSCSLTLEDLDRSIATRIRAKVSIFGQAPTAEYNYARLYFSVGHPLITEDYYAPLGAPFKIQRPEITDTSVELSLLDASDDLLLAQVSPPNLHSLTASLAGPNQHTRADILSVTPGYDWFLPSPFYPAPKTATDLAAIGAGGRFQQQRAQQPFSPTQVIPIPFGGWTQAPYVWATNRVKPDGSLTTPQNNPTGVIVLGASKNPNWMKPHWWGDCDVAAASNVRPEPQIYIQPDGEQVAPLLSYGGVENTWQPDAHQGCGVYIDVHTVPVASTVRFAPEIYYVAVMYVVVNVSSGTGTKVNGTTIAQGLADQGYNMDYHLTRLALAASKSRVWVDWQGLSASTAWGSAEKAVAANVIGYLCQYHAFDAAGNERGASALRGETRILDNYDDALTADGLCGTVLGGAILEAKAGSDITGEICATAMMDQAHNAAGRLALRPAGVTGLDLSGRIKQARAIEDNQIVAGSWRETAPRGNDRWGWGNFFAYDGVQDVARILGWDGTASPADFGAPPAGQVVNRTINISWWRQDPFQLSYAGSGGVHSLFEAPYQEERAVVSFDVQLGTALGLELGDYVTVTYYAAANADGTKGWTAKLCRIEGLDVRWPGTVGITALVMADQAAGILLYADRDQWTQQMPVWRGGTLDAMVLTSASTTVQISTAAVGLGLTTSAAWVGSILKISPGYNPVPYPASNWASFAPAVSFASRIVSITDATHFVLADAAPASTTAYAWRVQYTHENPPPASAFTAPWDFFDTAPWTKYAQLADLTTGTFQNGDLAQRFPGA